MTGCHVTYQRRPSGTVWALCPCGWQTMHETLTAALNAGNDHLEEQEPYE